MAKIPLEKYGEKFSKYVSRVKSAYLKPFRDEIRAARNESEQELLRSPLGRKIWGGTSNLSSPGPGKPRFLVGSPKLRFSKSETHFVGGFKILGMAALMIKGGRTESHIIKPVRAQFLRFDVRGDSVVTKIVNHPGGGVREVNVIQKILEKRVARFKPAAIQQLDKAARESFR